MAKELHIKIPDEQIEFMTKFKSETKVSFQKFIIKAIQEKIETIKKTT